MRCIYAYHVYALSVWDALSVMGSGSVDLPGHCCDLVVMYLCTL